MKYYLAHGHHRYRAYKDQDHWHIPCVRVDANGKRIGKVEDLPIDDVLVDERTQQRKLNPDNMARLIDVLVEGGEFHEPIEVCDDLDTAIDYSCRPVNAQHGQPETRADRERRTKRMIERHSEWSPRRLAEHCGVSKNTVAKYKLESGGQTDHVTGKDGKLYPATKPRTQPFAEAVDTAPACKITAQHAEAVIAGRIGVQPPAPAPAPKKPARLSNYKQAEREWVSVYLSTVDAEQAATTIINECGQEYAAKIADAIGAHALEGASNG